MLLVSGSTTDPIATTRSFTKSLVNVYLYSGTKFELGNVMNFY